MNGLFDHPERMQIAGYIELCSQGFAVPAYKEYGLRGNAWYLADPEIDGDHRSGIASFETLEDGVEALLTSDREVRVGDPWLDVFLWREQAIAGTPTEIYHILRDHHDELRQELPLTFLDLSLAADTDGTPELAHFAHTFLTGRLGEQGGASSFRELVVRSGIRLELNRHAHRRGLRMPRLEFAIKDVQEKHYLITLTDCDPNFFSSNELLIELRGEIARFGEAIGASIDLADLDFVPGSQPAEERISDPPIELAQLAQRPIAKRRRTRLLGFAREVAIDLGTARTRIYAQGRGTILSEPTVVALQAMAGHKRILAVGEDALLMRGREPEGVEIIQPMRDGVIADIEVTIHMLQHFMRKVRGGSALRRPMDVIVCVPSSATGTERRAVRDAVKKAGASQVYFISATMAAAIGAGLPVLEASGSMIVHLGSGVTQVAVITLRGMAYEYWVRMGGDAMTEAIVAYIRRCHNFEIGFPTAERLKIQHASLVLGSKGEEKVSVRGKNVGQGVVREHQITKAQLAEALSESVDTIVEAVRIALENIPPELAADIVDAGLVLTGGTSLLSGLDRLLADETGLRVRVARDPLNCVTEGLARVLDDPQLHEVLRRA